MQYTAACLLAVIALVVMLAAQRSGTAATTVMVAAADPTAEASADRLRVQPVEPEVPAPRSTMSSTTTTSTTTPTPATSAPATTAPATSTTAPTTTATPASTARPDDPLERTIITLHGDEVLRDAERELRLALAPAAVEIDATAGLSLLAASPRIAAQHRSGLVDVVVIAIGAHDEFPDGYEDLVDGTFDSLDHVRCVVWVTSEETTEGVSAVNAAIARQAERHDNAVLADWADAAVAITTRDPDGGLSAQARDRYALVVGATVRECISD